MRFFDNKLARIYDESQLPLDLYFCGTDTETLSGYYLKQPSLPNIKIAAKAIHSIDV